MAKRIRNQDRVTRKEIMQTVKAMQEIMLRLWEENRRLRDEETNVWVKNHHPKETP